MHEWVRFWCPSVYAHDLNGTQSMWHNMRLLDCVRIQKDINLDAWWCRDIYVNAQQRVAVHSHRCPSVYAHTLNGTYVNAQQLVALFCVNESCHVWMSHVTHECVRAHVKCSPTCSVWVSQVDVLLSAHTTQYEWVMSRMHKSRHTYEIDMSWTSHVTRMNESCHTYEWVMSHIWMSHVTHMNESCHVCVRHVTRMNESCHTYEWVMSHIWMSHVTHTNESCHTYEFVMSHVWTSHVTHMYESCHTYEWVMPHI